MLSLEHNLEDLLIYLILLECVLKHGKQKMQALQYSHRKSYTILDVAKMFKHKIKFIPKRSGERYASALTNKAYNNNIIRHYGKINLKDYITSFIKSKK